MLAHRPRLRTSACRAHSNAPRRSARPSRRSSGGGDILAQRQYAEKQYEAARAVGGARRNFRAVRARARGRNAPDEASRTSCAESITAFLNGVPAALVDVEGVAGRCTRCWSGSRPGGARGRRPRLRRARAPLEQRAEQLFSSLSDGVQAELVAALSAESFGTPASGCVRRAAPPSSGRLGPPSSAASSGGMSDCGQFRVPFAPRSGRPSIGEMPGRPSCGSPAP